MPAHPDLPSAQSAEAIISGTLCLMSCYVQHPVALYAERVCSNLARLAALDALSPELRVVCRRLSERWDTIVVEARERTIRGDVASDARALH